jgi:hypothetical protein
MYRLLRLAKSIFRRRPKVFGIGMGKTGTTSLERAFLELGYRVGPQNIFERHFDAWAAGDYSAMVADIERFEAFQDVPFCFPRTYRMLDNYFPQAKYILTVRDSSDQWYRSLCRFHSKVFGRDGALPTEADLKAATYVSPGWAYRASQVYGTPPGQPYDRNTLVQVYETHIGEVQSYFAKRRESLLVLNVAEPDAFARLTTFLELPEVTREFPHLNQSA